MRKFLSIRRKRIMRSNLTWFLVIVGALLTLAGIILGFVGAEVLNLSLIHIDAADEG